MQGWGNEPIENQVVLRPENRATTYVDCCRRASLACFYQAVASVPAPHLKVHVVLNAPESCAKYV